MKKSKRDNYFELLGLGKEVTTGKAYSHTFSTAKMVPGWIEVDGLREYVKEHKIKPGDIFLFNIDMGELKYKMKCKVLRREFKKERLLVLPIENDAQES